MRHIEIFENNIYLVLGINEENQIKLLHFSVLPLNKNDLIAKTMEGSFNIVELNISGLDRPLERHGTKYIVTAPGYRMKYSDMKDYRNESGRKLEITTFDEETKIYVISHFQFFDGISVIRSWSEVINKGSEMQTLEYVSSFNYTGIEKEGIKPRDEKLVLKIPHNSWQREMNWQEYTLEELGIGQSQPVLRGRYSCQNLGN